MRGEHRVPWRARAERRPASSDPHDLLDRAECVGIFPSVFKGAFVFGARYGKGVISCRSGQGWSAPANFRIEGGNVGFQIGGSSTDIVLLFIGERSIEKLHRTRLTAHGEWIKAISIGFRSSGNALSAFFARMFVTYYGNITCTKNLQVRGIWSTWQHLKCIRWMWKIAPKI
jgi:lipid-binding SYLF domain-containing protein